MASNWIQIIEQAKFTYSTSWTDLETETEKQIDAWTFLSLSDKTVELKQIQSIFPHNIVNDLICNRLKEIK